MNVPLYDMQVILNMVVQISETEIMKALNLKNNDLGFWRMNINTYLHRSAVRPIQPWCLLNSTSCKTVETCL